MKRILNIILTVVLTTGSLAAQDMFVSSGSAGKSEKASLSWVVGGGITQNHNDVSAVFASGVISKQKVALSIKENVNTLNISVYPNPAVEVINVAASNKELLGGRVFLTDMSGKRVLEEKVNSDRTSLYVSSLASGIYMVNTVDKYGKYTESVKIVKK